MGLIRIRIYQLTASVISRTFLAQADESHKLPSFQRGWLHSSVGRASDNAKVLGSIHVEA